jgi:hypothetical protein
MRRIPVFALALMVAGGLGCRDKDPAPSGSVAEETRQAAREVKQAAQKVGSELREGAQTVAERAGPAIDRVGHDLKKAGDRIDDATADERAALRRETGEALGRLRAWIDTEAKPEAREGARALKDDLRALADGIERKLDRLQQEAGPAAERTRRELREDLDKLRAKVEEARKRGL